MPKLEVTHLRFEHHPTGLGIGVSSPRLSWRFSSPAGEIPKNWEQTSYEVEIHRPSVRSNTKLFTLASKCSTFNAWSDIPLASREVARVRVRVNGLSRPKPNSNGAEIEVGTEWTAWHDVEAGLLSPDDWAAKCIGAISNENIRKQETDAGGIRPVRLRKIFHLPKEFQSGIKGRLYITALGVYEAYLNGERIGDEHMSPGWTSYDSRLQYQVYDVGSLLRKDVPNTLAIEVAEGWYAGRLVWREGVRCIWGDRIGAIAQLEISSTDLDNTPFQVVTDETWSYRESAIISSGIYDGECYDMRLEEDNWRKECMSSNSQSLWKDSGDVLPFPTVPLRASAGPPVRVTETIQPVRITQSPSGKALVDFGQNIVGGVLIRHLRRPEGHKLQIRHAEVLEDGELSIRPLRAAKATDTIIFGDSGELRDWSPHFTFHGFRYIEVQGWGPHDDTDPLTLESISALLIHTDMKRTGFLTCSNELVNKLHENIVWSMRGNFLSVPTDCPQRDERLGWTGDIQVFAPTASFLYDCAGMLGNWMQDVLADQAACGGVVPFVVPNVLSRFRSDWGIIPQAIWDDVVVLLPWALYRWFGDINILRESFSGMKDHIDKAVQRGHDGLWDDSLWQLGDWLDPNAPPQEPGLARTDGTLVADEYLVYVTGVAAQVADVLDLHDQAKRYSEAHVGLRQAFNDKYVTKAGLVGDSQTALALAISFSLHENDNQSARATAGALLAKLVRYAMFRVSTGFAGTPQILTALSSTGHLDLAYAMLLEKECPSWLYQVSMGATTMWERWDSMLPDGSINPGQMTSFNHYALGSVAEWMHANIGGLSLLEEGWKTFAVQPQPGGDIISAKVEFLSPFGLIKCSWKVEEGRFRMELTVPPNSSAVVTLPCSVDGLAREGVGSGEHIFECVYHEKPWPPKPLYPEFRTQPRKAM